ncbi:MAG: hypothetical protein KDI73_06125, partial [Candidatus Competibacteraceae bacterium]|nr:hypothetical protein [Candidatus Competibacteraceae bacterium]
MNPYTGLPLETLTEALSLAQAALPKLTRGEAVGAISTGDQRITCDEHRALDCSHGNQCRARRLQPCRTLARAPPD